MIKIYLFIEYRISKKGLKLIKLLNGNLALCYQCNEEILFYKDFKYDSKLETHKCIQDFSQLKNGN